MNDNTDVKGATLQLSFAGKESAWHRTSFCRGDGENAKDRTIFEDVRVLHDFTVNAGLLKKGITSYPFSIFLPKTIAPSMEFEETSGRGGCAIRYSLRASLDTVHIERKVEVVGATVSTKEYPYWLAPTCIPPKPHGLPRESCFVIGAHVRDTHVGKGQHITFAISFRNLSKVEVKRVDVRLEEEIHWTASSMGPIHHENTETITLVEVRDVVVNSVIKEPSDSHISTWTDDDSGQPAIQVNSSLRGEMSGDVHAKRNQLDIVVPLRARDSYGHDGAKLIRVNHSLKIIMVTREKSTDPHVSIPIKIMDPPINVPTHRPSASNEFVAEAAATVMPKDPVPAHSSKDDGPTKKSTPSAIPIIKEITAAD